MMSTTLDLSVRTGRFLTFRQSARIGDNHKRIILGADHADERYVTTLVLQIL